MSIIAKKLKLPADWQVVKLGKEVKFIPGFAFPATCFNEDGRGMPVIKTGDITKNTTEQFYEGEYEEKYIVKHGDILIGLSGTIVAGKWRGPTALLNQRVVKLDDFSPRVSKDFISYSLPRILKELEQTLWKAAVKNILKHHLEELEFVKPPLPEQQKIVYVLDTIQEAIWVQEKIIELTKELKKSAMANLFKYGAPSFRKGRKLKKTEIGEIPKSWEIKELDELGELKDGDWILNRDYTENGVRLIQIGDVGIGRLEINSNRFITENRAHELGCTFLMPGQILISRMPDPIGRACIVPNLKEKMVTAVDISIMTPNIKKIDKNFLVQFLNSEFFFSQCHRLATGATRQRISRRNLEKTHVPLPSLVEQQEIAEILQTIDQKIEIEQKKKELYEELFRAMLNKLMTAEIRVKDIEFK